MLIPSTTVTPADLIHALGCSVESLRNPDGRKEVNSTLVSKEVNSGGNSSRNRRDEGREANDADDEDDPEGHEE